MQPIKIYFFHTRVIFFFLLRVSLDSKCVWPLRSILDPCIVYETCKFFNKANVTFKLGLTGTIYNLKIILLQYFQQ